jgi:hypothetical protein
MKDEVMIDMKFLKCHANLLEEAPRISFGRHTDIGVFKGEIGLVRECHPGQGGLPRLSRPKDGHHGILRGGSDQFFDDGLE